LNSLNIVNKINATEGKIFYILSLIKREELVKELFIMDIEEGGEVYIPLKMNQEQIPRSFRYYDPIMNIIIDNICIDKVDYFNMKRDLAYQLYLEGD